MATHAHRHTGPCLAKSPMRNMTPPIYGLILCRVRSPALSNPLSITVLRGPGSSVRCGCGRSTPAMADVTIPPDLGVVAW